MSKPIQNNKITYKGVDYYFIKVDIKSETINECYYMLVPDILKNELEDELTQTSSFCSSTVGTLNKQDTETILKELIVITKDNE